MQPLDEKALRRDPFSRGYAVELADGQKWTLPAARIRVFPEERDDGSISVAYRPLYAADVEAELDVIFGIAEAGYSDLLDAKMTLVSRLLRVNYDLPRGALAGLLTYMPGEPDSERRWEAITGAILGRDPSDPVDGDEAVDGDPKAPTPAG